MGKNEAKINEKVPELAGDDAIIIPFAPPQESNDREDDIVERTAASYCLVYFKEALPPC